jgi:flagella basal body P-ring formation protein FlgA
VPPEGKEIRAPEIRKQRRRGKEISQGPMRNFRKLQGLVCKTKFHIDLKP